MYRGAHHDGINHSVRHDRVCPIVCRMGHPMVRDIVPMHTNCFIEHVGEHPMNCHGANHGVPRDAPWNPYNTIGCTMGRTARCPTNNTMGVLISWISPRVSPCIPQGVPWATQGDTLGGPVGYERLKASPRGTQ